MMAESVGVLGTAVGVASLGIQVCQGLLSFCSAYRDQNSRIEGVYVKLDGLTKILALLRDTLPSTQLDHGPAAAQVEDSMVKCSDSIMKLQYLLQKYDQSTTPNITRDKVQAMAQKALFPFRQETLQKLESVTRGLQDNLDTTMLVLQL
jgi:hypothetical protein